MTIIPPEEFDPNDPSCFELPAGSSAWATADFVRLLIDMAREAREGKPQRILSPEFLETLAGVIAGTVKPQPAQGRRRSKASRHRLDAMQSLAVCLASQGVMWSAIRAALLAEFNIAETELDREFRLFKHQLVHLAPPEGVNSYCAVPDCICAGRYCGKRVSPSKPKT